MIITHGEALERISERVYENTKSIRQNDRQRRDRVVDMYGVEFTRVGDGDAPARFYISVSPDMVYLERFQFKLIVSPFVSTVSGGTSAASVRVNDTSLSVAASSITPNPHSHTTDPHTHNVNAGVTLVPAAANNYRISVEGIDVSAYLMAQHGIWIDGEGVWPSTQIEKNFDLLEVAGDMYAEGRKTDADMIVRPGYKPIEISANGAFTATMSLYIKYSHSNR